MITNSFFDSYFCNVNFSKNIGTCFKYCFLILRIPLEGTVSHNLYLGLGFYFMSKIGKHFVKENLFLNHIKLGPK